MRQLFSIPCHLFQSKSKDVDVNPVTAIRWTNEPDRFNETKQPNLSSICDIDVHITSDDCDGKKGSSLRRRYLGLFLAILASIFCSLTVFIAKVLGARYHPFNIGFWKFQGTWIPSLILIVYNVLVVKKLDIFDSVVPLTNPAKRKNLFLLILRAFMGCSAVLLQFYSLLFISVADSSVIRFSTPILVTVVAYFFLHEAFSIVQILMAITSMLGVFILARPPFLTGSKEFDMDNLLGAGLALGAMTCTTVVFICLRFLRGSNSLLVILIFGIWGSAQCLVLSLSLGKFELPSGMWDWTLATLLALLTFLGQVFITLALKYEQSGVVSLVRCLDVVFAFVYQFIFLGISPDIFSLLGALLVLMSVGVIGIRKWISELPEGNPVKRKLRLLLK